MTTTDVICHICGAAIKNGLSGKIANREYVDQDGDICEQCFTKELIKLCRSAT